MRLVPRGQTVRITRSANFATAVLAEISVELAVTGVLHERAGAFRLRICAAAEAWRDRFGGRARSLGDPLDLAQAHRIIAAVARGAPHGSFRLYTTIPNRRWPHGPAKEYPANKVVQINPSLFYELYSRHLTDWKQVAG